MLHLLVNSGVTTYALNCGQLIQPPVLDKSVFKKPKSKWKAGNRDKKMQWMTTFPVSYPSLPIPCPPLTHWVGFALSLWGGLTSWWNCVKSFGRQIRPLVDALSSHHEFPGKISTWGPIVSIVWESDWETKVSLYNLLISARPVTPQTTRDSSKSVYFYFLICLNYKIKWLCCYVTATRKLGADMCSKEISFGK